jgi:acyl-CoA synthetase (AMP-forming)/AMP-acid ligase II
MEKIWSAHWPPGVDASSIQLPTEPLPVVLARNARRLGDRPAIVFYGRTVTFAELDEASDRFAGWLVSRGLRPGDRVAINLQNCPQFAIAYYGAWKAGAVNVCLTP